MHPPLSVRPGQSTKSTRGGFQHPMNGNVISRRLRHHGSSDRFFATPADMIVVIVESPAAAVNARVDLGESQN